jgi:hypothetical protein
MNAASLQAANDNEEGEAFYEVVSDGAAGTITFSQDGVEVCRLTPCTVDELLDQLNGAERPRSSTTDKPKDQ